MDLKFHYIPENILLNVNYSKIYYEPPHNKENPVWCTSSICFYNIQHTTHTTQLVGSLVTNQIHTQEIQSLNPSHKLPIPTEVFCGLPPANHQNSTLNRLWLPPPNFLPIQHSHAISSHMMIQNQKQSVQ
jgi:hypothetical protein